MNVLLIVVPMLSIRNDVSWFVLEISITRCEAQLLWHLHFHRQ
jgi:hypothetical protein